MRQRDECSMTIRSTDPSGAPQDHPLTEFFYRIDFLNLASDQTQPLGFHLVVAANALKKLSQTPLSIEKQESMITSARDQLFLSDLKSRSAANRCHIEFRGESACPLYFETAAVSGARIGVDPLILDRLQIQEPFENVDPDEIRYTMQGGTAPKQVLALLVMVIEWARHARWALLDLEMPSGPAPLV